MATRRRYTIEEEQIIAQEVSLHPTNITRGLMIAADRIGRSYGAVTRHWYAVQSKRETCFLVGSQTTTVNRKESSCRLFKKILKWLGL